MRRNLFHRQGRGFPLKGFLCLVFFMLAETTWAQLFQQDVHGIVRDQESRQPVAGANLRFTGPGGENDVYTDGAGAFRLKLSAGRWNVVVTHVGYSPKTIQNLQVSTGKSVDLEIPVEARVYETQEVQVSAGTRTWLTPSGGSSVRTLQSQDATRFAGGYYDPLRMVANFAGITSGNSDESNEIVVRGNSPRGLLWRLEGMEIPNPNHLSGGVGNNGGAYSMISTNVLADFDFYTGAFPAEFGNALSGVMDLRLRKGNTESHEFGLQLSVVGAELSAEGPLGRSGNNSYLFSMRYANFDFLKKYGIVSIEDLSIIPSSFDWCFKMNFHGQKLGELEIFSVGGNSQVGNEASSNKADIRQGINNDEFMEEGSVAVVGIRHLKNFGDGKTYIRSIAGFTRANENWHEGIEDTTFNHVINKQDHFISPAFRGSVMVNRKINPGNSIRAGIDYYRTFPDMFSIRRLNATKFDTLVNQKSASYNLDAYLQWRYKPSESFELVPALHYSYIDISREWILEPRVGMVVKARGNQSVNFGMGYYSRPEPLPVYYFNVKTSSTTRSRVNSNLQSTRAFHLVAGYRKSFRGDFRLTLEGYFQHLFHVPVSLASSNTFSMVNISDGLPDIDLDNKGVAENTGLELTLDKSFSRGYYALATFSLFDSRYKASNRSWYSTYYNSNTVFNLVCGKEFKVGRYHQNVLGFNLRNIARGGYRYTPPDEAQSIKKKAIVWDVSQTFGKHLPFFDRIDAGVNYKINRKKSAFNFSVDIQNAGNRHNVYRRNFSYSKGVIVQTDRRLIGLVPIAGIRFDF